MKTLYKISLSGIALMAMIYFSSCGSQKNASAIAIKTDTLVTNANINGQEIQIQFEKGPKHNYPLMAFWIEDATGKYIETIYIAESIANGVFAHGQTEKGKWLPGPIRRPATLPYWAHKRGVQEKDGLYMPTQETAIADAISGATPLNSFILNSKLPEKTPRKFKLLMEINQTWDWNEYWTNNKYPNDEDYKTSCQPSLIYKVEVDLENPKSEYQLEVIGHGHYSGKDGSLTTDLSTITTALNITKKVVVYIK